MNKQDWKFVILILVIMAICGGFFGYSLSGALEPQPQPVKQVSYILKRIEVAQVGNGQYSYSSLPGWVAISFDGRYVTLRKVEGN